MKRNEVGILGAHTCFSALVLFVNVFLVAQVYTLTNESITSVGLFMLLNAIFLFTFFALSSILTKTVPAIWLVRISAMLLCVFIITVIATDDNLANLYVLYGIIWGIVQGLYWGAMNFLLSVVGKKGSVGFFVYFNLFATAVSVIFPFTFGMAIEYLSFIFTSGSVLGVAIIMLGFLMVTKFEKTSREKFQMIQYFKTLKANGHLKQSLYFFAVSTLLGWIFTSSLLTTVLIIIVYGSSMSLGVLGSIFGIVGILSLIIYKRASKRIRGPMYIACGLLPLLATIPLFFLVSPVTIIIFNATIVLQSILWAEESEVRINMPKYLNHQQFQIESNLFYEFAFVIGRILSCGMLIVVGIIGFSQVLFATAITMTMVCLCLHTVLVFAYKRKLQSAHI